MTRTPKSDVLIAASQLAWSTMVIVTPGHYSTMDVMDEISGNRIITWKLRNPAIGVNCRPSLSLRTREFTLVCLASYGFFKFPIGKISAFDLSSPRHFTFQLNFMK